MCNFVTTLAGYHVPVLPSKPQKGDVRYKLYYDPDGVAHVFMRTFNGHTWI